MIRIVFKNLDESIIAKEAVQNCAIATLNRFPDLENHQLTYTLSMDNSQFKPGPDLFKVKVVIKGKKYGGIILQKSASSLYTALAELYESTHERLNRFGDRQRVKKRAQARKILQQEAVEEKEEFYEERSF